MEDFNSQIGKGEERNIANKYGLGTRNERCDWLIQFCQEKNLTITNTIKKAAQDTPERIVRNQIYAIVAAKTYPGADITSAFFF